jgi:hypothetical protein
VLLEFDGDSSRLRLASAEQLTNVRSFICELAVAAGAADPDALAYQWHILMKGSIVTACAGDLRAAERAQDIGRLLLTDAGIRHDPARGDRLPG